MGSGTPPPETPRSRSTNRRTQWAALLATVLLCLPFCSTQARSDPVTATGSLSSAGSHIDVLLSADTNTCRVHIDGTFAATLQVRTQSIGAPAFAVQTAFDDTGVPATILTVVGEYTVYPKSAGTLQVYMQSWISGTANIAINCTRASGDPAPRDALGYQYVDMPATINANVANAIPQIPVSYASPAASPTTFVPVHAIIGCMQTQFAVPGWNASPSPSPAASGSFAAAGCDNYFVLYTHTFTNDGCADPTIQQLPFTLHMTTAATAVMIAGSGSLKTRICSLMVTVASQDNVQLVHGTGSLCVTGKTNVAPNWNLSTGFIRAFGRNLFPASTGSGDDVCATNGSAVDLTLDGTYVQQ